MVHGRGLDLRDLFVGLHSGVLDLYIVLWFKKQGKRPFDERLSFGHASRCRPSLVRCSTGAQVLAFVAPVFQKVLQSILVLIVAATAVRLTLPRAVRESLSPSRAATAVERQDLFGALFWPWRSWYTTVGWAFVLAYLIFISSFLIFVVWAGFTDKASVQLMSAPPLAMPPAVKTLTPRDLLFHCCAGACLCGYTSGSVAFPGSIGVLRGCDGVGSCVSCVRVTLL